MKLSKNITLEFVQSTHSIPQAVFPVLHTPEGIIVYALDFKFDNHQKVSPPPDYKRLRELGRKGVLTLIVETTNAKKNTDEVKTYSERIARNILEDVMHGPLYEKKRYDCYYSLLILREFRLLLILLKKPQGNLFPWKIYGKVLWYCTKTGYFKIT